MSRCAAFLLVWFMSVATVVGLAVLYGNDLLLALWSWLIGSVGVICGLATASNVGEIRAPLFVRKIVRMKIW